MQVSGSRRHSLHFVAISLALNGALQIEEPSIPGPLTVQISCLSRRLKPRPVKHHRARYAKPAATAANTIAISTSHASCSIPVITPGTRNDPRIPTQLQQARITAIIPKAIRKTRADFIAPPFRISESELDPALFPIAFNRALNKSHPAHARFNARQRCRQRAPLPLFPRAQPLGKFAIQYCERL